MSDDFVAIYKCRLCEEKIRYGHAGNYIAVSDVVFMSAGDDSCKAKPKIMHFCNDGSVGLADFLGYKKEGI